MLIPILAVVAHVRLVLLEWNLSELDDKNNKMNIHFKTWFCFYLIK